MLAKLGNILCVTHVCMSVYLHIWGYGCIHVCVYTHVCAVSLYVFTSMYLLLWVCLYMCLYMCIWVCLYTDCVCVYTYVRMNLYMYMCLYMCVPVYLRTCVYLCISMHMYLFTYGCLYLYVCIYVYIVHCVSISVYILAVKNLDNRTAKSWVQDSPIIIVWPWGNFLTSFSFDHFIFRLEIITHASEIVLRGI